MTDEAQEQADALPAGENEIGATRHTAYDESWQARDIVEQRDVGREQSDGAGQRTL